MKQKVLCHDGACIDITDLRKKDLQDYLTQVEEFEIIEM